MMRILGLCSYPNEAAATRFRLEQFVGPLADHGIELTIAPFFGRDEFTAIYSTRGTVTKVVSVFRSVLRRIDGLLTVRQYDLVYVQREAMMFGPPVFEWLYSAVGSLPLVLDLDDATYLKYESPTYGRFGSAFKFFGKTDRLIDRAAMVVCGNPTISEYVKARGGQSVVLPTTVDGKVFHPVESTAGVPVIGWIGTHSTYPFLEKLFPVIKRLAEKYEFKLKIVGSGKPSPVIAGVEVENTEWRLETEVADFQLIDIGLYPMFESASASVEWLKGKSGFKAIQYMAVGRPFVMSPVGVASDIGIPTLTHLNAVSDADWYDSLDKLLSDENLRKKMGIAGREHFLEHYDLDQYAKILAETLLSAARDVN